MFSKRWNPNGLHVYITGGSSGLGLSLACLLTKKGAHVSISARNQDRLDEALECMEAARQNASQLLRAYSFSLDTASESEAALHAACEPHNGQAPDAVFTCAGAAKPMFFVQMTENDLTQGMVDGYWVQAWTVFAAAKLMVKQQRKGKIVLVSSTLGYMTLLGYGSYSPAKQALRSLADTLQSELMLYDIDVHIFFPPMMPTAGYDRENKTKPKIVLDIESTDDGITPDEGAAAVLSGLEKGYVHITADWITTLFRASTRGAAPRHNWFLDGIYDLVAYIAMPIWRTSVDTRVRAHRQEHREYLQKAGFFD